MLPEQDDLIRTNWLSLMQIKNIEVIAKHLTDSNVFHNSEISDIFSTSDDRHNKRMFLFNLREKDEPAFQCFVQSLIDTGHNSLAELLKPKHKCSPFRLPDEEDCKEEEEEDEKTSSIEVEYSYTNPNTSPLNIKVKLADDFHDSPKYNSNLQYYQTRSKNRGRVLIINNYEFLETKHKYRKGAIVDEENIEKLFNQMGGYVIEKHSNKTTEEMRVIMKDFTKYKSEKKCDICFVFIMSHGCEELNKTIIYGIDGKHISATDVQSYFTNKKCKLFKGKPKVFIYQVCRGSDRDISIQHTDTDGMEHKPLATRLRSIEDMLIGYATLQGYKAHRDTYRGTWYIELICQNFMEYANKQSVDHLLMMVDQGLRKRLSEDRTMQTSEVKNKGFKKLYLNPGIYQENGAMKKYGI
ncbi:caspase-3-like [Cylas formicarius]|uniref:caspase-3-like n=1 Tax=Cylas formicarius TaxID=197179 RepID=UPI002958A877|nr:caspase-3-like [Cylas formicarius]